MNKWISVDKDLPKPEGMPLPDKPNKPETEPKRYCSVCRCTEFSLVDINFSKKIWKATCNKCGTRNVLWV